MQKIKRRFEDGYGINFFKSWSDRQFEIVAYRSQKWEERSLDKGWWREKVESKEGGWSGGCSKIVGFFKSKILWIIILIFYWS